jgi:hypothetical protein
MYIYDSWIKDAFENSIKITDKGIIINVHVIIEKEDDLYSAHCLEFDLVGEGENIDQAQESIIDNIINHITFAISKGLYDKIIDPAPPEYWNKLLHSKFLKPITIQPEENIAKERNQFPFLSDLSGKIDSYQCCYA